MFAELLENPARREPADLQSEARCKFASYVTRSQLLGRQASAPIPFGSYIVIGIASYSPLELALLDEVNGKFADWQHRFKIATFDMAACQTVSEVMLYLPGLGPVARTPIVALWQDKQLVQESQGLHETRELLKVLTVIS
jgi:hypothetical protein